MSPTPFKVSHIDHVEFFVPDQVEAAAWYRTVLGLEILPAFEHWAVDGPLMISTDGGRRCWRSFAGSRRAIGRRPAFVAWPFGWTVTAFNRFWSTLGILRYTTLSDSRLTADDVVDHGQSWSIYFQDPYGHPLEVTTYDVPLP